MISFSNANRSILIKNPEFNDSKSLGIDLGVHTMMDSSVSTYRTPSRIAFQLEFSQISRVKAEEVRDFFDVTSGQLLTYVDLSGVSWQGYLIGDTLSIENEGKGRSVPGGVIRSEGFRVTFDFEVTSAHSND